MNKITMLATSALLMSSAAAFAQTNTNTNTTATPGTTANAPTAMHNGTMTPSDRASSRQAAMNVRQRISRDLQQAGFTDVQVVPDSFLVQAKDKAGEPVTMMINPTSMTEVVGDEASSNTATGDMTNQTAANAPMFTSVPQSDRLSSKLVGLEVYNNNNQQIGTIKDVALTGNRIQAYIVGVGGFLGMGDHNVAVNPRDVHISYDQNNKTWKAAMNATADQLKAAPQYQYPHQT